MCGFWAGRVPVAFSLFGNNGFVCVGWKSSGRVAISDFISAYMAGRVPVVFFPCGQSIQLMHGVELLMLMRFLS